MSRNDRNVLVVLAIFGLIYGLVSFPNHALFRTYALDLGLYTHALWHYAHFQIHDSTLFLDQPQSILADHFDLYLPLFSPVVFLFGTWTLLIIQWISVLAGASGIRRLLLHLGTSPMLALVGMVIFLLYFGVFAAMAFDYHSNVVAAMILPWFLLAIFKEHRTRSLLLFILMLMAKENMGFWLGPIAIILCFDPRLSNSLKQLTAGLGVFGLVWSITVIGWVMPAFSANSSYAHFDYSILGTGIADVPHALIDRPIEILKALFVDHIGVPLGTQIKLEFWWMMLVAGGWALLLKPRWGLMALPLIAQKMLHDDAGKWSIIAQYGIEFAPLLAIAVPLALVRYVPQNALRPTAWVAVVLSLVCTIRFMDRTVAYHDRSRIRIYQSQHYVKSYDLDAVRDALNKIPPEASVSAQSPAVPHLAIRERLYQYPIIRDAEYLVLLPQESPYPLGRLEYQRRLDELLDDPHWIIQEKNDAVILMNRR